MTFPKNKRVKNVLPLFKKGKEPEVARENNVGIVHSFLALPMLKTVEKKQSFRFLHRTRWVYLYVIGFLAKKNPQDCISK